jgi:hypothetical protein
MYPILVKKMDYCLRRREFKYTSLQKSQENNHEEKIDIKLNRKKGDCFLC